jgi:hypothetical protein
MHPKLGWVWERPPSMRSLPVLLILLSVSVFAETLPRIAGENLLGQQVILPEAAAGHPAVLVLGFSHASQGQTKAWGERLNSEYPDASGVIVYPIAVLEDVPRLVRGMASHGIKSGTPKQQRARFLLVYHNEAELKMAVDFSTPDDAYILSLDRSGEIRWRFHGAVTDSALMQLQTELHTAE